MSIEEELLAEIPSSCMVTIRRKTNGRVSCIITPSHLNYSWAPVGEADTIVNAIKLAKKSADERGIELR